MFDLLQQLGLPSRFRNWLAALWSSASSKVILNGVQVTHSLTVVGGIRASAASPLCARHQPLQHILETTTHNGDLHRLCGRGPFLRTSLYADDVTIFLAPIKDNVDILEHILKEFGDVTGLLTNVQKCLIAPIGCSQIDLDVVLANFLTGRSSFPMKYLGLPLSVQCLRAMDFQTLLAKMRAKLIAGRGANITLAGRNTYIKSVLTCQAIHHLIPLHIKKGVLIGISTIMRAFLGAGTDKVNGGKLQS